MKAALIIGTLLFLCSCQEPYEKAVSEYINKTMNNPGSYERIELGKPQIFSPTTMFVSQLSVPSDSIAGAIGNFRKELEAKGGDPDQVLYYTLEHEYRIKNNQGGKDLHKEIWYLSEDQTSIFKIEPK